MWQLDIAETKDNNSEPDKESPTWKASKQTAGHSRKTNAHCQAQPKHEQVVVEISPPKTPFQGPTSKREYSFHFLSPTYVSDSLVELKENHWNAPMWWWM